MKRNTHSNKTALKGDYGFFSANDVKPTQTSVSYPSTPGPFRKDNVEEQTIEDKRYPSSRVLDYPPEFAKVIWQPFEPGPTMYAIRHLRITEKQFLDKIRTHKWHSHETEKNRKSTWMCVIAQRYKFQDIWEGRYLCCFTKNCYQKISEIRNEIKKEKTDKL